MLRKYHGVEWTTALITRFEELTRDKTLSYNQIATKLSSEFKVKLTKNACIGKGRRLGVEVRVAAAAKSQQRKKSVKIDAPIPPKLVKIPPRDLSLGLTIYELREGDCKWVLDKLEARPPFRFCGMPAIFNCPWCKTHRERAYATPRERAA